MQIGGLGRLGTHRIDAGWEPDFERFRSTLFLVPADQRKALNPSVFVQSPTFSQVWVPSVRPPTSMEWEKAEESLKPPPSIGAAASITCGRRIQVPDEREAGSALLQAISCSASYSRTKVRIGGWELTGLDDTETEQQQQCDPSRKTASRKRHRISLDWKSPFVSIESIGGCVGYSYYSVGTGVCFLAAQRSSYRLSFSF